MLGVCAYSFRRDVVRYEDGGLETLHGERYDRWTVQLFPERYRTRHGGKVDVDTPTQISRFRAVHRPGFAEAPTLGRMEH